jgi:hypothetical protein
LASSYVETEFASSSPISAQDYALPPIQPAKKIRVIPAIVMFAVGFIAVCAVIHLTIRRPIRLYAEIRSEKLSILDQWRGHADSAAFGSSHVDTGFDPRAFDRELHDSPSQTTTLNLGISGGSQTEQASAAQEFLASLPAPSTASRARFVLLEITAGTNPTNDHLFHPRSINIYDLDNVRLSIDFAGHNLGLRRELGRSGFGLAAGGLHYVNVGMLSSAIFHPDLNRQLLAQQTGDDRRGLTPTDPITVDSPEYKAIHKLTSSRQASRPQPFDLVEGYTTLLRRLSPLAKQKNVQLIYFVAPSLNDLVAYPSYPDSIAGPNGPVPVLDVARPDLHPELYQGALWHDPTHLNETGAAVFSRLLADELLADELKDRLHSVAASSDAGGASAIR